MAGVAFNFCECEEWELGEVGGVAKVERKYILNIKLGMDDETETIGSAVKIIRN